MNCACSDLRQEASFKLRPPLRHTMLNISNSHPKHWLEPSGNENIFTVEYSIRSDSVNTS